MISTALVLMLVVSGVVGAAGVSSRPAAASQFQPQAGQRNFAPRFSTNVNGQITIAANTIMKCPVDTNDTAANNACNGSRSGTNQRNNNSYDMRWLDFDSDPSTFDSSKADLVLPTGGHVLFAGLYWTGMQVKGDVITFADGSKGVPQPAPNAALIGQVGLRVPGSATYSNVTASMVDTGPISLSSGYGAFADVTSLVNAAGAGSYYVGNVQTGTGGNAFGGWSLVVAYSDPTEPLRNLTVFDGLKIVSGSSTVTIPLSGFKTPSSGTVRTTVGVVAAEGDAGATGDYLMVNGNVLSDAVHPANNTENSTIANRGSTVTTKGPDWSNQLGYDSSLFAADGFLANGATMATFTAQTTGDVYAPQAITFATELYSPNVTLTKTVDKPAPKPGETITYTITAANGGPADAVDSEIVDDLPGGLTLSSATASNGGTVRCTPSPCGASSGSVSASFGTLGAAASRTLTIVATVNGDRPLGEVISNLATLSFVAPDLGLPVSKVASVPVTVAYPDIEVTKTLLSSSGNDFTFQIEARNVGTISSTGAIDIVEQMQGGGGLSGSDILSISGTNWTCGSLVHPVTTVTCSYPTTLAAGAAAPVLTVVGHWPAQTNVINEAHLGTNKGGQPSDPNSPALLNDSSTAASGVSPYAVLTVNKSAVQPEVGIGGNAQFRMLIHNQGPSAAPNAILSDTVPAGVEVDAILPSQGTCSSSAGAGGTTAVTCSLGSVAVGDDATVVIVVSPRIATAGSTVTNSVSVSSDLSSAVTDTATLAVRPAVDLSITKSADRETANPGDVVHYTITVINNGPVGAPDVSVVDHLPVAIASATASASNGGTCVVSGGVVDCLWTGDTAIGATVTVTIDATIRSSFDPSNLQDVLAKHAVNVAQASSAFDEIDQSDNEASVLVKVTPYGDLAATASGPGVVAPGSSAQLMFQGINNGPTTTTSTVLTIEVPTGLTVESIPANCAASSNTITCDLGTMTQGATTSIPVVVSAPAGSAGLAYLSTVSIASAVDDPFPENNSDLTPLYSTQPPSIVSITPGEGPVEGGTQVTIDGDNLTTDTVVEIGGVPCAPVWFNSAQQIVCTTGAHPAGSVDVVVRTPDGQSFTFVDGFTYIGDVGPDPNVPKFTG